MMKCCGHSCGKEIDVSKGIVPPEWFGVYRGEKMLRVICKPCIDKSENKDWWKD
jgi:hypothetical protein